MRIRGEGPIPSRIMLVGEFPSERDLQVGVPFQDAGGMELSRMLHEASIMRSECYVTTVVKARPPGGQLSAWIAEKKKDITAGHVCVGGLYVTKEIREGLAELQTEIEMVQPNLIVAFGNLALWALTENWGVMKWRGSLLRMRAVYAGQAEEERPKVIPTYAPAAVLRQWDTRAVVLNDLRRVRRHMTSRIYDNKPEWRFQIRPSFEQVMRVLGMLQELAVGTTPLWLDFDIETAAGHIDCIGLSWSRQDGICIPLMRKGSFWGYWDEEQETAIVYALYKLLTHPNVRVRWQNGLYDAQYVHRHWHFIPNGGQDTMISQHSLFAALPKGLAFIASMYADWYVYWKDEGKTSLNGGPEDQRWSYNLQDCVYTREVGEVLTEVIKSMGLAAVDEHQQAMFWPVLKAMIRGVRIRTEAKNEMALEVQEALSEREAFLFNLLGHGINPSSPKQMQALFYDDLRLKPILNRTVKNGHVKMSPTCDDEALRTLAVREPLVKPICDAISDIRTLHKFLGDFIMMPPDIDGRMRCSFNIAGDAGGKSAPYSYRLSSSKNPFGSGGNLQTIPSEKSKSSGKAMARGTMKPLPNIRRMYGPDPGFTFFDMDLDRADLQVVVWESDDAMLKAALRMGADIHLLNTYGIDNKEPPPLEELVETHPRYPDHRGPRKHKREFAKVFCHACVTAGHEVLTRSGWWPIEHLQAGTEIAVWNINTQSIHFEVPSEINRDVAVAGETLYSFEGQAYSQEVTADHRMPYTTTTLQNMQVAQAQHLPASAKLPTVGFYSGSQELSEPLVRLLAAFQADGTFDYKYRTRWHLKKERKIKRLLWLLEQAELTPTISNGWNGAQSIAVYWRPVDWMKTPGAWLLDMNGQALDWWLDELKYWDGYQGPTGAVHISSSSPEAAEWINTIAQLRGQGSRCYLHKPAEGNRKDNWHVSLNNRQLARKASLEVTTRTLTEDTPVYCPATTTGFFMVRRNGKISVTGNTNYLGKAKTVAAHTGRGVHEIDQAQKRWFLAHPGILAWHERVTAQVQKYRFVENKFGYRWYIFDRIDEQLLPAAVAWIPQSTVGIVINKTWRRFYEHIPEVQVLLQVHDSLAGQFPTHRRELLLPKMQEQSRIVIPYDDPLIIPTGIKTSTISWGDCE